MFFYTCLQNSEDLLFQVILEKTIRIPRSLSVKAGQVLRSFLNKNPVDRLGCHGTSAFSDITGHPFFKSIDWDLVRLYFLFDIFFNPQKLRTTIFFNMKIQHKTNYIRPN